MKKKTLIISMIALAAIFTIGATAYGASELIALENKNETTQKARSTQVVSSNTQSLSELNDSSEQEVQKPIINNGVQEIKTTLESYGYPTLTVQKGVAVKWIITADENNLNGCNNKIIIPEYNISKELAVGENVIEFTPKETGVIPYSCWMGMINGNIAVVDDINNYDEDAIQEQIDSLPPTGGCCAR